MCGCDKPAGTEGRRWVIPNRMVFGSGRSSCMTECLNLDDEVAWEMHDDQEQWLASGPLLCWPHCFSQWVEMKMAETDIKTGKL